MQDFISEDDLETFEGWLKYQAVDPASMTPEQFEIWSSIYQEGSERVARTPKVGRMKLPPGEHRYAVAIENGGELWLTLWVKRSRKGEFFVMIPRRDRGWDVHTSYHLDGTLHMKSFGHKVLAPRRLQPLTTAFRGSEHLGIFYGHGPKSVGAICDPTDFSGVVTLQPGLLGPKDGAIAVDLVEPGKEPRQETPWTKIFAQATFSDASPWVVITVGTTSLTE
jgi:hypothetical protein